MLLGKEQRSQHSRQYIGNQNKKCFLRIGAISLPRSTVGIETINAVVY
jgi:hypothetical protein